jgi:hypothetical protein
LLYDALYFLDSADVNHKAQPHFEKLQTSMQINQRITKINNLNGL